MSGPPPSQNLEANPQQRETWIKLPIFLASRSTFLATNMLSHILFDLIAKTYGLQDVSVPDVHDVQVWTASITVSLDQNKIILTPICTVFDVKRDKLSKPKQVKSHLVEGLFFFKLFFVGSFCSAEA